jgi:hypothetical protein
MSNRICSICNKYVQDVWVVTLSDDKEKVEFDGHKVCVDELHDRIKNVKDLVKKPVKKVLKELSL